MSSPFSIFRKNQRGWMAALVVLAIISFIVLPAFDMANSNRIGGVDTAVRWKNGKMSFKDVEALTHSYQLSYQFLDRLARDTIQRGGLPSVPNFAQEGQEIFIGLERPTSPELVVQTRLLAEEAERRGVVVDDATADLYIQQLTAGKINQQRYLEILRETAGRDLTQHSVNRYIKDEISKQLLLQMQASAVAFDNSPLITPAANWENFRRFEQRAKIEAFPVITNDFIDQIKEQPTDRALRDIYEQGKEFLSISDSPEFGFRKRYAADVEFVKADLDKFINAEKENVTPEQLQAEYDRRVAAGQYKVEDKTGELEPTAEDTAPETTSATEPASDTPATSESPAPATESTSAPEEAAAQEPESPAPGEADAPESQESPATEDGASAISSSGYRLVAFQDEASEEAVVDAATAEETPAVAEEVASSEGEPAGVEPNADQTQTDATAETTSSTLKVGDAAAATPAAAGTPADEKPMRTQTLDEVREQLLLDMVRETARNKVSQQLEAVKNRMEAYSLDLQQYRSETEMGVTDVSEPAVLNLAKLADEYGLEYGSTGMVDALSVRDLEIGKSVVIDRLNFNMPSFAQAVLIPTVPLLTPVESTSFGQESSVAYFLSWKLKEEPSVVPPFEAVRDEVVNAWKQERARELAQAKATELQLKLQTSGDWSTVLSETEQALVLKPGSFTWLQPPRSQQIMTSIVELVGAVTNEFMSEAFNTPIGSYAVAASVNKDRYFVIKPVERTPGEEDLRSRFEKSPLQTSSQQLAAAQSQLVQASWFEKFRDEIGLDMSPMFRQ